MLWVPYRKVNSIQNQVNSIQNQNNSIQDQVSSIQDQNDSVRDQVNSVQNQNNNIQKQVSSIQNQLDNMPQIIFSLIQKKFYFKHEGFCPICEKNTTFVSENVWLRDFFFCTNCGSVPRQRALMLVIEKYYPNWRNMIIHESSPTIVAITEKFKSINNGRGGYITSQYYPEKELGIMVNGYRNENLEMQTFEDEIFDIVITQDVFEHLYNPEKAFIEIARTLKHGGAHIFTVPIINKFNKTEQWAKADSNGNPIFLKSEERHVSFPVTFHYGFDIINLIKEHSGLDTIIESLYNLNYGIWAEYNEVFICKKE